ncbi:hypothetical protein [Nitrosomonas sp.]|uniref:hypothetical protein n=1 Tax=Nitrosomonas sp. TaxID=42353 RepID=UPI00262B4547|nr:hypothetical protein [Nitrosomonas sp.]
MVKLNDDIEKIVDESMLFIDGLHDTSQLKKHGCMTVAQCALLLCMHNNTEKPDRSEDAGTYIMLALHDIKLGKLQVLHPETLLPWAEYMNMIQAGMYRSDNELEAPMVTAGWLVRLDECEKWYHSKGLGIDLSVVKSDLEVMDKNAVSNSAKAETPKSISTQQVADVFQELHYGSKRKWKKYLADPPGWLNKCRLSKGTKGSRKESGIWDPVKIALELLDKGVSEAELNILFKKPMLRNYADEWKDQTYDN